MTDKEKIRAEIERLKESGCASPIVICDTLLAFIDSMHEEPVSEDLDKFATQSANKLYPPEYEMADDNWKQRAGYVKGCKDGAKWQKQQIMKDAVKYEYQVEEGGMSPFTEDGSIPVLTCTDMIQLPKEKFKVGDKVKLIIFKED